MRHWIVASVHTSFLLFSAWANAGVLQGESWSVSPDFENNEAREEISGAVCPAGIRANTHCLAVNDDKRYAQFFTIRGKVIEPLQRIGLLPKTDAGVEFRDIDAEAAAYDDGFVYVTGSHGLSRGKSEFRASQFFVFRFPIDRETGAPAFAFSKNNIAPEIARSAKLRHVIQRARAIGPFAERPLAVNGANIEGMAVIGGQMYFGLRGPSLNEHAFAIEVSAESVFGSETPAPRVHELRLGYGMGIRDLARVNDGLLVLSGDVNALQFAPKIYHWNPQTMALDELGELASPPDAKAETLLILEEQTNGAGVSYRVLILFDGPANGAPVEYTVSR